MPGSGCFSPPQHLRGVWTGKPLPEQGLTTFRSRSILTDIHPIPFRINLQGGRNDDRFGRPGQ
jgi:hypothetical protein